MAMNLIERYEAWYARRLDSKPIGAVKKLTMPSGPPGRTLSGVLYQIHTAALVKRGWEKSGMTQVSGSISATLVEYRKMRQPES